jgi:hypothetical protein
MIQNRIVCFRIDEHIDHRISRILGSRYFTRSRFIRTAIEYLLSHEECVTAVANNFQRSCLLPNINIPASTP